MVTEYSIEMKKSNKTEKKRITTKQTKKTFDVVRETTLKRWNPTKEMVICKWMVETNFIISNATT